MIKLFIFILSIFSVIFIPTTSMATTGGPQEIELLGYEAQSQKLYLLRHYQDGRGRLPQLYYYQLNSKTPDQLIEVKSLYINPQTKKIDYDQDPTSFDQELAKIQKRLIPLIIPDTNTAKMKLLSNKIKMIDSPYVFDEKIEQYHLQYQISNGRHTSGKYHALAYHPKLKSWNHSKDPLIYISQIFVIPKHNKMIAVARYFGIPWEFGYDIDDPVLLLPKQ